MHPLSNNFTLSLDKAKEKYGKVLTVKRDGYNDIYVILDILCNSYLRKYTIVKEESIYLHLLDTTCVEKFYDTLLFVSPVTWFYHKADSLLESVKMDDLPSKFWSLLANKRIDDIENIVPNFYDCLYDGYDGWQGGDGIGEIVTPKGIYTEESLESQAFLAIVEEYPIFLEKQEILLDLLLLPELYPCVEEVATKFKKCIDINALRQFHRKSLVYEIGLVSNGKDCLFLPINHTFFSVTTATKEDIQYLLSKIVGNWLLDIDMSKTSLTGSMISCVIFALIHCQHNIEYIFSRYLSYDIEKIDLNSTYFQKGIHDYANSSVIINNQSYPIKAGADVDLAIDVRTEEELLQEATKHYKIVKKYYSSSIFYQINITNGESKYTKYKITTTNKNDYVIEFRDIDMYTKEAKACQHHHIAPVRAYWDGDMIYATQSCVDSQVYGEIKEYRVHNGKKSPVDVLCRYINRGYSQKIIPNPIIKNEFLVYDVIGYNGSKIDQRVLDICSKSIYPKEIEEEIEITINNVDRFINNDYKVETRIIEI